MSETIVITSRANLSFFLRPHVRVAARSQSIVPKEAWDEWFSGHLDSPLLAFLDWPGKGEPVQRPPLQELPSAAGAGELVLTRAHRSD